jgi:hypothetical protein
MIALNNTGIKVYRVMKDSINPARIKRGMMPITFFIPFRAPCLKEASREYVPGNR